MNNHHRPSNTYPCFVIKIPNERFRNRKTVQHSDTIFLFQDAETKATRPVTDGIRGKRENVEK